MTDRHRISPEELQPLAPRRDQESALTQIGISRAAQEVQAAMVIAKRFPRDPVEALAKLKRACQRRELAEMALYAYPRGGTTVTGPSIRLAEELARDWGNLDFGIVELEQRRGESSVMAYAWDLESNTRQTKIFNVKHMRHTRERDYNLTDPRDIYEMTANQGARRLRACILGLIPGDIVDVGVSECEKTMAGDQTAPLADRVRNAAVAFRNDFGITQGQIEERLGHRIEATSETELVQLRKIYASLRDNMAAVEQFFPAVSGREKAEALAKRVKQAAAKRKKAKLEPEPEAEPKPAEAEVPETPTPGVRRLICPKCQTGTYWSDPDNNNNPNANCLTCGTPGIEKE